MRRKLNRIEHVLWDWNGTLIDDAEYCSKIIAGLLYKHGLRELSFEEYRDYFCFPVERFYEKLGLKGRGVSFEETSKSFIEEYEKGWKDCFLHNNAEYILKEFYNLGIKQSIITAGDKRLIGNYVSHFGISHYFESLVGTENILAAGKIEAARRYVSNAGLDGSNVVVIGDTLHDAEVAKEIGADILLYANGHNSELRLSLSNAVIIKDLGEVSGYVK